MWLFPTHAAETAEAAMEQAAVEAEIIAEWKAAGAAPVVDVTDDAAVVEEEVEVTDRDAEADAGEAEAGEAGEAAAAEGSEGKKTKKKVVKKVVKKLDSAKGAKPSPGKSTAAAGKPKAAAGAKKSGGDSKR